MFLSSCICQLQKTKKRKSNSQFYVFSSTGGFMIVNKRQLTGETAKELGCLLAAVSVLNSFWRSLSHLLLWSVCTHLSCSLGQWRCERSAPGVHKLDGLCQCVSEWSVRGEGNGQSAALAWPRRNSKKWHSLQAWKIDAEYSAAKHWYILWTIRWSLFPEK